MSNEVVQGQGDSAVPAGVRESSVQHGDFVIEQRYPVSVDRTFGGFSDQAKKAKWFASPDQIGLPSWEFDFRVGGGETNHFEYSDAQVEGTPLPRGTTGTYRSHIFDIVQNERIVLAYEMIINGERISVSLQTWEFTEIPDGTLLKLTEQATFMGNSDGPTIREHGMRALMDALAASLG